MDERKSVEDILKGLEDLNPREQDLERIKDMADEYNDKSEKEIFFEMIQLKEKMERDMGEGEYQEIFEKLDAIRPLLNEEQLKKLDEILNALENE